MSFNVIFTVILFITVIIISYLFFLKYKKLTVVSRLMIFLFEVGVVVTLFVLGHSSWNRHEQLAKIINVLSDPKQMGSININDNDVIVELEKVPTPRQVFVESDQPGENNTLYEVVSLNGEYYIFTLEARLIPYFWIPTYVLKSIEKEHKTTPSIDTAFLTSIQNQNHHIDGGTISYEQNRMRIIFELRVKNTITEAEAKTLVDNLFDDVRSITGQHNNLALFKPYKIEFQIVEDREKTVLYQGLKKMNSLDIVWTSD